MTSEPLISDYTQVMDMSSPKLRVSAQNILTYVVKARKTGHNKKGIGLSLYVTIEHETAKAMGIEKGDLLTIAVIKHQKGDQHD